MVLLGEGPRAGLQGATTLDEMLQYQSPHKLETVLKMHKLNPRLYEGVFLETPWQPSDEAAVAQLFNDAKEGKCVYVAQPRLESRFKEGSCSTEYRLVAVGLRPNRVSILKN